MPMKYCLALLLTPILLFSNVSCGTVEPDGGLKDLVDGEIFSGDSRKETVRHDERQMEPLDAGGPLRWKMRF